VGEVVRCTAALRLYAGAVLFLLAGLLLAQAGLAPTALAAATAAAALLLHFAFRVAASSAGPVVPGRIRTAMRERALRTAFLAQRDPDASGRPRPRAPGRGRPTTA
jgi:uncharacterized protein DUF6412